MDLHSSCVRRPAGMQPRMMVSATAGGSDLRDEYREESQRPAVPSPPTGAFSFTVVYAPIHSSMCSSNELWMCHPLLSCHAPPVERSAAVRAFSNSSLKSVEERRCHWHHHRPCERRLLHRSRLLQRHVCQPDLHGVGDIQLRQQVGSPFGTWRFGLSNHRHP